MRDRMIWRELTPREDGFIPAVKRIYRLRHAPLVFGDLCFSHFVNGDALYEFCPMFAHQCCFGQLVDKKAIEELKGE